MTIEEAGELVLGGRPWVRCQNCQATGTIRNLPRETKRGVMIPCGVCEGRGYKLSKTGRQAYEMLGVEIPPKPMTPREHFAEAVGGTREDR